jgi:hypothetical protein
MGENMNMNFQKNKTFSLSKSDSKIFLCIPTSHVGFALYRMLREGGSGRGQSFSNILSASSPQGPPYLCNCAINFSASSYATL